MTLSRSEAPPASASVRACIASRFRAGDSIGRLAFDYGCKPTDIQHAIREEWLAERARRRGKRGGAR